MRGNPILTQIMANRDSKKKLSGKVKATKFRQKNDNKQSYSKFHGMQIIKEQKCRKKELWQII